MKKIPLSKISSPKILVLFLFVQTACSVGPDFEKPETKVSDSFSEQVSGEFSKDQPEQKWWASFKDPQLDALVEETVKNNKDILQALTRINQSREIAKERFADLFPTVNIGTTYEKSRQVGARFPSGLGTTNTDGTPTPTTPQRRGFEYEVYTAGATLSAWEIDLFGRVRRGIEAADANVIADIAGMNDTLRLVVSEVGVTYFQLRGLQAQLEIAKENLDIQEKLLRIVKVRFEEGEVSELDYAQANTELEQAKAAIIPLEGAIKVQLHRIAVLTGKQPQDFPKELLVAKELPGYFGAVAIGDPASLLLRRPDIKASEQRLAAQTALIGVEKGRLLPTLSITGNIGVEALSPDEWKSNSGTYTFGPRLDWSILSFTRIMNRVREANEKAKEALYAYEKTVLVALEEVENSLSNFSTERARMSQLNKALKAAERSYKIAEEQYREGETDFTTALRVQSELLQNRTDYVVSRQNVIVNLVGVYKSLGGGW